MTPTNKHANLVDVNSTRFFNTFLNAMFVSVIIIIASMYYYHLLVYIRTSTPMPEGAKLFVKVLRITVVFPVLTDRHKS